MVMLDAASSAAVGARPMLYVTVPTYADGGAAAAAGAAPAAGAAGAVGAGAALCASADPPTSSRTGTILNERIAILDTPVTADLPRHDCVVQSRCRVRCGVRRTEEIGDLLARRLDSPGRVGGARHDQVLAAVPVPH